VGDKLYGSDAQRYLRFVRGALTDLDREQLLLPTHALHASRLACVWRQQPYTWDAPEPALFEQFCVRSGLGDLLSFRLDVLQQVADRRSPMA
jgi:hypothetical protein